MSDKETTIVFAEDGKVHHYKEKPDGSKHHCWVQPIDQVHNERGQTLLAISPPTETNDHNRNNAQLRRFVDPSFISYVTPTHGLLMQTAQSNRQRSQHCYNSRFYLTQDELTQFARESSTYQFENLNSFDLSHTFVQPYSFGMFIKHRFIADEMIDFVKGKAQIKFSIHQIANVLANTNKFRVFIRTGIKSRYEPKLRDFKFENVSMSLNSQPIVDGRPVGKVYEPIDITALIRQDNVLLVKGPEDLELDVISGKFMFGIYLMQKKDHFEMIEQLKNKTPTSADFTLELIHRKLSNHNENQHTVGDAPGIKIELTCPLSGTRMITPVRSILCDHAQCFDAQEFIQRNEITQKWTCPICEMNIRYRDLIVDGYTLMALFHCPQDVGQIYTKRTSRIVSHENERVNDGLIDRASSVPQAESNCFRFIPMNPYPNLATPVQSLPNLSRLRCGNMFCSGPAEICRLTHVHTYSSTDLVPTLTYGSEVHTPSVLIEPQLTVLDANQRVRSIQSPIAMSELLNVNGENSSNSSETSDNCECVESNNSDNQADIAISTPTPSKKRKT